MSYSVAVRALCEFTAKVGDLDLRFTPSPAHTDEMMDALADALEKLWVHCNIARVGGVAA